MVTFTKEGSEIFRDYETDGVPTSGAHKVIKADMRTWMGEVKTGFDALGSLSSPIVTPEDFGAVGNGSTDDTTALQNFFNNTSKTGRLKAGATYKITPNTVTIPGNTFFWGPKSATIKNATGAGTTLKTTASDVRLRGFTIDGGNSSSTLASGYAANHNGFTAQGAVGTHITDIVLDGLTVKNCGEQGIKCMWVTRLQVRDCYVVRCGYAGIGVWTVYDATIDDNVVDNIYPGEDPGSLGSNCYGIVASVYWTLSGVPNERVKITGNVVSNVMWEGIDEHDSYDVWICKNHIRLCGTGVAIEHHTASVTAQKIHVCDNTITGFGLSNTIEALAYPSQGGILVNGAVQDSATDTGRGMFITGNNISNIGDTRVSSGTGGGISIRNFRGVHVSNNYIDVCYKYGIIFTNGSVDAVLYGTVIGNTIDGTKTVGGVAKDIFASTRVALQVVGNFTQGNGDGFSQSNTPTFTTTFASNNNFS